MPVIGTGGADVGSANDLAVYIVKTIELFKDKIDYVIYALFIVFIVMLVLLIIKIARTPSDPSKSGGTESGGETKE